MRVNTNRAKSMGKVGMIGLMVATSRDNGQKIRLMAMANTFGQMGEDTKGIG